MPVDITIPSPGESVSEVTIGAWHKADGDWVEKDDLLVEIESDKATLEIPAPEAGVLHISAREGAELPVGEVIGSVDPDARKPSANGDAKQEKKTPAAKQDESPGERREEKDAPRRKSAVGVKDGGSSSDASTNEVAVETAAASPDGGARATSLARKIAQERGVDLADVEGSGPSGRITKSDVLNAVQRAPAEAPPGREDRPSDEGRMPVSAPQAITADRAVRRQRMSRIRQRIAERLVEAQRTAAMLTTFNEADMSSVMRLRKQHKDEFLEKHGVGLGFMSFFVTACVSALKQYEGVNSYVVGDEIEYHDYVDISVAVGTPRGLVVPVVRNADRMSFAGIELAIKDLAERARSGQISVDEMMGGTFTITNGGIYGSLQSTPILNPPQSGILGMHRIMNRPIEDPEHPGQIVLRPMMYLALSYDHRVVDGEQAVKFLVHVKECIEHPQRLLLGI